MATKGNILRDPLTLKNWNHMLLRRIRDRENPRSSGTSQITPLRQCDEKKWNEHPKFNPKFVGKKTIFFWTLEFLHMLQHHQVPTLFSSTTSGLNLAQPTPKFPGFWRRSEACHPESWGGCFPAKARPGRPGRHKSQPNWNWTPNASKFMSFNNSFLFISYFIPISWVRFGAPKLPKSKKQGKLLNMTNNSQPKKKKPSFSQKSNPLFSMSTSFCVCGFFFKRLSEVQKTTRFLDVEFQGLPCVQRD